MSRLFKHIFWIDATDKVTAQQCYEDVASEAFPNKHTESVSMEEVKTWMGNLESEWLLVLDNSNEDDMRQFLPPGKTGNILYTSRRRDLAAALPPQCIANVNDMEHDDAITLLLLTAGHLTYNQELRAEASPVVTELGCLPLAIDQAGAYIRNMGHSLSDYLALFRSQRDHLLRDPDFKGLLRNPRFNGADPRNQAVYATFDISYNALHVMMEKHEGSRKGEDARNALNILRLICFYHNESLMVGMFGRAAGWRYKQSENISCPLSHGKNTLENLVAVQDRAWDSDPVMFGIMVLEHFSLAKWDHSHLHVSMHVLVHDWAKNSIGKKDMAHRAEFAKAILFDSLPYGSKVEDLYFRRRIYPHVEACLRRANLNQGESIVSTGSKSFQDNNDIVQSESDMLGAIYNAKLGVLYKQRGQFGQARKAFNQSIELSKFELGYDHEFTLKSMGLLADLEESLGVLGEAEFLLLQVKELRERRIDDIIKCRYRRKLKNDKSRQIARVLGNVKRPRLKQSVATEDGGAQEHAISRADAIARDDAIAQEDDNKVVKGLREKNAEIFGSLAEIYVSQSLFDAAEEALNSCIKISKELSPEGNPAAERSLQRIRDFRNGEGSISPPSAEGARASLQENIEKHGYYHKKTFMALETLARVELEAGNIKAAEEAANEFILACGDTYGEDSRESLGALMLFTDILTNTKQYIIAEEWRRFLLAHSQRVLGKDHPYTIECLFKLGISLPLQGRVDEGLMITTKALAIEEARLGATHFKAIAQREALEHLKTVRQRVHPINAVLSARDAIMNYHIHNGEDYVGNPEMEEDWVKHNHLAQYHVQWGEALPEMVYFTERPPLITSLFLAEEQEEQERRHQTVARLLEHGNVTDEFA